MAAHPWQSVAVPVQLISQRGLPLSVRGLYIMLAAAGSATQSPLSIGVLRQISGVHRTTLRDHLQHLVQTGWAVGPAHPGPAGIISARYAAANMSQDGKSLAVPAVLAKFPQLPPSAKALYAFMAVHGAAASSGWTVGQSLLRDMAGLGSNNTLRRLLRLLQEAGWLHITRRQGQRTFTYHLLDPHLAKRKELVRQTLRRLDRERFKGEALMKEMLNVAVDDNQFEDNARPGFLVNPLTGEHLELDRWYTEAQVAFEFNGPQHYRTTDLYPDFEELRQQQARDLMKTALAGQQGIRLVVVQPPDLCFDRLRQLAADLLPMRQLPVEDPVVRKLTQYSRGYRRRLSF